MEYVHLRHRMPCWSGCKSIGQDSRYFSEVLPAFALRSLALWPHLLSRGSELRPQALCAPSLPHVLRASRTSLVVKQTCQMTSPLQCQGGSSWGLGPCWGLHGAVPHFYMRSSGSVGSPARSDLTDVCHCCQPRQVSLQACFHCKVGWLLVTLPKISFSL